MSEFKSFFDTPKKTRLTVACLLAALVVLGCVAVCVIYLLPSPGPGADAAADPSGTVSAAPGESGGPEESAALMGIVPSLTIEEARALALADAGVAEDGADVSREALAEDNGIWVYEFRFRTEQAQYEYKINANTGDVRSMVKETFIYPSAVPVEGQAPEGSPPAETAQQPAATAQPVPERAPASAAPAATAPPAQSPSAATYIGVDQAKAIALNHAGLSADQVAFTKAGMDREHGTMVYEIEFRQGGSEYEYEIDAVNGGILSYDHDIEHGHGAAAVPTAPAPAPTAPAYISTDEAKAAALSHAGLSASQAVFTHVEKDWEHGAMVYEVEFRQGRVEYEYKIDAASGSILSYERDAD